ncbi:MinD/ParA family protein [Spiribacter halobius]|uniref:MinD/ParA family protein n=1 Tax=Sediminicurvatus halobius TaxID=2182432 RepID=UPI001304C3A6|nr:MinD/ParA family protein [Spiribacter halobius]UEX79536.1 MinD/ParA family protein [Spiribacter halobius]
MITESDAAGGAATTLAVTSGKGGVGKTSLATNLAIALARGGSRVCLLDADMGLANVNILLGLRPERTLEDVISGEATLAEVLLEAPEGLRIVPAASGLERLGRRADAGDRARIAAELETLERQFDYLIVDTPAGIGAGTLSFLQACDAVLLTITTEPTSLTDAFTLLKTLRRREYAGRISVMVNMLPAEQEGDRLFRRFDAASQRHLGLTLDYLGHIGMDRAVTSAVLRQQPLLLSSPQAPAARQILQLAATLQRQFPPASGRGGFAAFWQSWTGDLTDRSRGDESGETFAASPDDAQPAAAPTPASAARAEPATVVTAPRALREAPAPPADVQGLADAVERTLADPELEESDARRLFATAERAFGARFRRRATDLKNLIYGALLHEQLPREHHREMLATLRASYRQRYGAIPDDETPTPEALAERLAALGDDTLTALLERLTDTLAGRPAMARRLLLRWLRALPEHREWQAEDGVALVRALDAAHQRRGDPPLTADREALRRELGELRGALAARRAALERDAAAMAALVESCESLEGKLRAGSTGAEPADDDTPPHPSG